jgi:hypothetical protein
MTTVGKSIKSKTGNAGITRQGHTSSGAYGTSVSRKRRYGTTVRDLKK